MTAEVQQYRPELLAYAYRLLRDAQDAEDCVQNAFLTALRSEVPARNSRAWLYRVVHNLAINALRKRDRQPPVRHPAFAYSSSDDSEELEEALTQLPEDQRSILLLRYTHGLTFEEIASVLGRPVGTVKVYAGRALAMLQKNLRR